MNVFKGVFCFSFLLCLSFVSLSSSLSASDKGVCVVKISSPRTRTRHFTTYSNKMCGRRKCVLKRTKKEKYTVSTNQTVCCNGWEYLSNEDECVPLCSTGCGGGRCVAPDVCACEPPARLDPLRPNTCLQSACDHNCTDGFCGPNNTCRCNIGYQVFNATHCMPECDKGYQNDPSSLACTPQCDSCANGTCTAPDNCTCSEGFKPSDADGTCQPKCSDPCVNGYCSAPGVCSCHDGFLKNVTTVSLLAGYLHVTVCYKPCEQCNGTCNAKGDCVPRGGCQTTNYQDVKKIENKDVRYKCGKKICMKKVKSERTVKSPAQIACCVGWEYSDVDETCNPQCKNGCVNGECVAPEECYCEPPLILNSNYTCAQPECEPKCTNAFCSATNTCTCNPGFAKYNATHCAPQCDRGYIVDNKNFLCVPECSRPCVNGSCTGPDACSCIDGHKLRDNDKYTCIPECNPSCEHSDCVAPDTCSCHEGYFKVDDGLCKPLCDHCNFGDCIAPNECRCHEGYSNATRDRCEPICSPPCLNGTCFAPGACKCSIGYKIDEGDKFKCVPVCYPTCINSTCSSTNTCSCHSGYEPENAWSCKPKCDDCANGDCIAPETCVCHEGFTNRGGKCIPHCDKDCTNGFCSEPNTCTCHIGYKLVNKDKFTCSPVCSPGCVNASCDSPNTCICLPGYVSADNVTCKPKCGSCVNGVCTEPDRCQCHKGYQLNMGICEPVCQEPCTNGNCSGPEVCTCLPEYFKNKTNPSECFKPCKGLCDMGTCTTEGICNCNSGFEFNNDTCVSMRPIECSSCNSSCSESPCWCVDGRPCYVISEVERSTSPRNMATVTWVFGGTLIVLLLSLVCVIQAMWRRRQLVAGKAPPGDGQLYSSVVYTVPDTLMNRSSFPEDDILEERYVDQQDPRPRERQATERLLAKEAVTEDEIA